MDFPFTSRTVGTLVRVIDAGYTDTQIGTLVLEAEADEWDPPAARNKQTRLQHLLRSMRQSAEDRAGKSALELARLVLTKGAPKSQWDSGSNWYAELRATVEADGWEYDEEREELRPLVPGVEVAGETTALEAELVARGWATAAGHYRQALEAYSDGNWASANAQLRSMLEDMLPAAAEKVSGSRPKEVQAALDKLRAADVLVEGEYSLVKGLWDLSQPRGSHPGLSDRDEASFRLMTVTSYCRFLLGRVPR